jgi:hypothetical protein
MCHVNNFNKITPVTASVEVMRKVVSRYHVSNLRFALNVTYKYVSQHIY